MVTEKLDQILAATARLLLRKDKINEASIVTHARPSIIGPYDVHFYDGSVWDITFHLPVDVYSNLDNRDDNQATIDRVMGEVVESLRSDYRINVLIRVDTEADYNEDWRREMARMLTGETISNQGRVRSDNIATIQYEGLLFRSKAEVAFYRAAKRKGLAVAPLPVFIQGGSSCSRAEPDFVVIKDGVTLIVELDGNHFHRETPLQAQERLLFLTQQGVHHYRISSNRCLTDEDAIKSVSEVTNRINQINRHR